MSEQKTIEQAAEVYSKESRSMEQKNILRTHKPDNFRVAQEMERMAFLAGAAKQRELDAEKIKDYEQALKFCASEDLFTSNGKYEETFKYNYKEWFQDKAKEVLNKWGDE